MGTLVGLADGFCWNESRKQEKYKHLELQKQVAGLLYFSQ